MVIHGKFLAAGVAALATATWLTTGRADTGVQAQDAPGPLVATQRDQVEVAVTVYNSNIALVRDVRLVALPSGESRLHLQDIAAAINPATVHVRSLTEPGRLDVHEQNYQFDLLDPQRLLRKYVGREVKLLRPRKQGGTTVQEEVSARLLSYNDAPVWQIGNEIVTGLQAEQYRFPEIPDNLHSRPTLVWQLTNEGGRAHRIETSYLTRNMNWNVDYVLTVGRDDVRADLDGWVTVLNTSGTAYRNARLQLVAGELNRVRDEVRAQDLMERSVAQAAKSEGFAREAFSEYHLYSLERRTTLAENETKQISMLSGTGIPVRKQFVVNGQQYYYRNRQQPGAPIRDAVRVYYTLLNDEASGLGAPMPAGVIRVYQADSRGGVQFAGEDRIGHTPKDENISLQIGTAFDVVCERRQTDFTRISDSVFETSYEITLRNHKSTAISVQVNEPLAGDWQMLSSSHASRKTDAFAAQFDVPVPAAGQAVLRYRVRVRY
jgi:hypothetical protein